MLLTYKLESRLAAVTQRPTKAPTERAGVGGYPEVAAAPAQEATPKAYVGEYLVVAASSACKPTLPEGPPPQSISTTIERIYDPEAKVTFEISTAAVVGNTVDSHEWCN